MLSIAICEDNIMQQNHLKNILTKTGLQESLIINSFESGESLCEEYEKGSRYSIIFLDMQLEKMDGIQTAEVIRRYDKNCLIIITTSIMEYAVQGYSINAYEFILKPIDPLKLKEIFHKAVNEIQVKMNKSFIIKTRDTTAVLKHKDIQYIESNRKGVIVHTSEDIYPCNESISSTEKSLCGDGFIRISRYYLVNIHHVKEIGVNKLLLSSRESLKFSPKYRDSIKSKYLKYVMEEA